MLKVVLSRRKIFLALVGGAGGCAVPVPGVNSDICTSDIIQGWDRSSYQEFYQCLGTGYKDTETRRRWQSTEWLSGFARKRMWDTWICGTAL